MTVGQVLLALSLAGVVFLIVVAFFDLTQKKHAIKRNFPIIGNLRYLLEMVGPELRQYIVTSNDEERPFSRDQRRWVYASSKRENNYFGFGTDSDLELSPNHLIVKHSAFPLPEYHAGLPGYDPNYPLASAKVLGAARGRAKAFRPKSIINISGMSFGALSERAVEAINRGSAICGALHNTGEGGVGPCHGHGGELIWQIGTGYFGCRDEQGRFSLPRLKEKLDQYPIRALEIKLSQGAKPGLGGLLPAAKVTPEIAAIRGIRPGVDCNSPPSHAAFRDVDSMLDFVEWLGEETGLPVGIKSAVGDDSFWTELVAAMDGGGRGVDFVTIDGGEGGTGAAPLVFTDHVALPFKVGFVRVYREFFRAGLHHRVVFVGSGRLGFPGSALLAMCLGCDLVHVAREAMLAIGCIQAQKCHTGHCPAGIATQSRWLMHGLEPTLKSARLANYVTQLRKELVTLSRACGYLHPGLVPPDCLEMLDDHFGSRKISEIFQLEGGSGWGSIDPAARVELERIMGAEETASAPSVASIAGQP